MLPVGRLLDWRSDFIRPSISIAAASGRRIILQVNQLKNEFEDLTV